MKNIILFVICTIAYINNLSAQIPNRYNTKIPTTSGLKIEIKTVPSVIVTELPDVTKMFTFKVFEVHEGTSSPNSLTCTSQLIEVKNFQVNTKVNLAQPINGGKIYSFNITGLKAGQKYGVDIFPLNQSVKAPLYLTLSKTGYTSGGYCNPSVVDGSPIQIIFQTLTPLK